MSTQTQLADLEKRHQALEIAIAEARAHPSIDDLKIVELKRRKLRVKDEIARPAGPCGNWEAALPDAWRRSGIGRTKGRRSGNYRHGRHTAEAMASRRWLRQLTREVRALTKSLRRA